MKRHRLTPTTFGLWAMNDSRFVFDVRNGRACFGATIRKVYRFMAEYEAKRLRLLSTQSISVPVDSHVKANG